MTPGETNYWTTIGSGRMSRRTALRAGGLGVAGLAAAALVGCGDSEDGGTPSGATGGTGTSQPSGTQQEAGSDPLTAATLIAAIGSDVGSMDPQSLGGTGGGNWPNSSTHFGFAGLAITDQENGDVVPNVAESWEESEDHLTITVKLRPDVKFHDGSPLTAEDVKFSMDRNLGLAEYNPAFQAGYSAQFSGVVDSTDAIDDLTVRFNLKAPDLIFFRRPLFIVPKAYIEEVGDDGFAANPVGLGHYRFVSRVPDSEIRSERYDDYHMPFGSDVGVHPSFVKTLVQRVIPDNQARIAALQAGEVDLIHNVSSDIARQLEGDDDYKVHYLPGDQPMMIDMNTQMEVDPTTGQPNPFRDTRVRTAANLAVDVQAIIDNLLTGREQLTFGSARQSYGFPEDLVGQAFGYDPERARALLAEAGYPDGFDTAMYGPIGRWPNSRPVMEAVGQYLREVGIRSTVQEIQYQEATTRFQDDTLGPLVFFGRAGGEDPGANFRYNYHSAANFTLGPAEGQDDIDRLIEESERTFDPDQRKELIGEVIRKLYLSAKSIWLYEPVSVVVTTADWEWDIWGRSLANPEYWNIRPA